MQGVVKFWRGGFGFIEVKDEEDVFVHFSQIQTEDEYKKLQQGQTVEFELSLVDGKRQANNVKVIL